MLYIDLIADHPEIHCQETTTLELDDAIEEIPDNWFDWLEDMGYSNVIDFRLSSEGWQQPWSALEWEKLWIENMTDGYHFNSQIHAN
jgi:hypothetical protein